MEKVVKTDKKIWFITGISSGMGAALATAAIERGDFVIGTMRQTEKIKEFNAQNTGRGIAIELDVTNPNAIDAAFEWVNTEFGRLDFLVNNAGFGFAGAVEETSDAETRAIFEANFFGTLRVTQAALPLLRAQKSGHILQISSHGGIKAFAGFGIYNASKFAVEGFSEALAAEIAPLGIRLTIVEPGPFRTGFADAAFQEAALKIGDYEPTSGAFRARMRAVNGVQEGDPVKAAAAILHITMVENPPLRLALGKIPLMTIGSKLDSVRADLDNWKALSESAVF